MRSTGALARDADEDLEALREPRDSGAAYAAMITRMDRDIGRLMDRLKTLGLDDHTLVLFGSDNGAVFALSGTDPSFFRSTGALRGYKQDLYEGGIRTPFIARWPGRIKPGTTSDFIGAYWDVLPTLCEVAGVPAPAGIDGVSIVPTLLGQPGQTVHEYLYWEYHSAGRRRPCGLARGRPFVTT